jgi:phage FluMu protein Com
MINMKRIAIIKESYIRDVQVLSTAPDYAEENNLAFDDNFTDVKHPCLYIGVFEGIDEDEIRKKAADLEGVHPDIISLVDSEQKTMCAICCRQPMKPKTSGLDEQDHILCPACGYMLAAADDDLSLPKFCPNCGQRLYWEKNKNENNFEFEKLRFHFGHNIEIVTYGGDWNVSIECTDCNEVLYSVDNQTDGEDK